MRPNPVLDAEPTALRHIAAPARRWRRLTRLLAAAALLGSVGPGCGGCGDAPSASADRDAQFAKRLAGRWSVDVAALESASGLDKLPEAKRERAIKRLQRLSERLTFEFEPSGGVAIEFGPNRTTGTYAIAEHTTDKAVIETITGPEGQEKRERLTVRFEGDRLHVQREQEPGLVLTRR